MFRLSLFLCALFFLSCEKNIDFKLQDTSDLLVVDGEIENARPPVIYLTKSFSFYSKIDPAVLTNHFVHDADVYVSNGILTHKLKEYSYQVLPGILFWYYSIDSSSLATAFDGELNKTYQLKVSAEGKEYTATTQIPALYTHPDSVFFRPAPMNPDTNTRAMYIKATDPPGLGNYIRYFTKNNNHPFLPGENSVYDDQVIDGIMYQVQLPQGVNKNDPPNQDDNFYHVGDTVTLKFCNIDRASFRFWSSWEFAFQSIGHPFAQPNTVTGNISNGALGAFCGYAAWYKTLIAQ